MELYTIIDGFQPMNDERLLEKARKLIRPLRCVEVVPSGACVLHPEEDGTLRADEMDLEETFTLALGRGQNICLDFGNHITGYLTLELAGEGSHPDAPAYLKLQFAEVFEELWEDSSAYEGWLSRSWIQEETVHVDLLPAVLSLPRRYAFRYVKITVLDTSPKYRLVVKGARCRYETSADDSAVELVSAEGTMEARIERVCLRTLANCMQDVFEDGPKRDRRLWMGDFRLQALAGYSSFRNMDLVRRCLYLFAGTRFPDGRVSACVFTEPEPSADDTWFFDYALFFPVTLEEYVEESGDHETLEDLYETAMQQIDLSLEKCTPDGLVQEEAGAAAFVDWCDGLDKRACAQAILIYAIGYAIRLAERKNDRAKAQALRQQAARLKESAMAHFWDPQEQCFVCGGQKAIATQVWMVLAKVPAPEQGRKLMKGAGRFLHPYRMVTPYMHHYYTQALLAAGLKEQAREHLLSYWGSMVERGADTFWETWDPEDPESSPYGGKIVNSYCHAWSCTPMIWLRNKEL